MSAIVTDWMPYTPRVRVPVDGIASGLLKVLKKLGIRSGGVLSATGGYYRRVGSTIDIVVICSAEADVMLDAIIPPGFTIDRQVLLPSDDSRCISITKASGILHVRACVPCLTTQ